MATKEMLTIKQVCAEYALSQVYVRRMIQKGKIKTTKVKFNANQFKHIIAREEIEKWRATASTRARRADGRNKFTLYATPAERVILQNLLEEGKLELPVVRANPPKTS